MLHRRALGFTLIELMLALALGLIVMAGLAQLFVGGGQGYASLQSQSRLQESGRYALAFIGRSARGAGYLGCNGRPRRIVNMLNGELAALFPLNITEPVEAFESDGGGSATEFAQRAGIGTSGIVPGADMVVFRRVQGPLLRVSAPVNPHGNPTVERRGAIGLKKDDFALIGDCEQVSLFRITGLVNGAGHIGLLRGHGQGLFANAAAKPLTDAGGLYGPAGADGAAMVGRVVAETYFIARGRSVDRRGNTLYSLWRRSGMDAPAELVEGIGELQVTFGIDTRPDDGLARVSRFVGFDTIAPGAMIRAVRVRVVADHPIQPRAFSQTFNLRNAG